MNALATLLDDIEVGTYQRSEGRSRRNNKPWALPRSRVEQTIDNRRRDTLLERHPGLAAVWEADAALRAAQAAREDALVASGVPVRVLAEYGADGGVPLGESKSEVHRIITRRKAQTSRTWDEIPF